MAKDKSVNEPTKNVNEDGSFKSFEQIAGAKTDRVTTDKLQGVGRSHEECDECLRRNDNPATCKGHAPGPVSCRDFVNVTASPNIQTLPKVDGHPPMPKVKSPRPTFCSCTDCVELRENKGVTVRTIQPDMSEVELRMHQYLSKLLNVSSPVSLSDIKKNIMSVGDTCSRSRQEIDNRKQLLTEYHVRFATLKMFHDILDTKQEIG